MSELPWISIVLPPKPPSPVLPKLYVRYTRGDRSTATDAAYVEAFTIQGQV